MIRGIHIEATNLCTLKCAGCARTQFIQKWPKRWKNYSIDIDQLDQFLDISLTGIEVHLCGTFGDPIYHPQFHQLIKMLKSKDAQIKITTNGSHKRSSWWEKLMPSLDSQDVIEFSIDGMPDTFTNYRENGDWDTLLEAIQVCVQHPIQTGWKYIPFAFNQNTIESAQQLSEQLGFDYFYLEKSDRFEDVLEHLKPDEELLHLRTPHREASTQGQQVQLDPKCHKGVMHYISSDGHYMPCCFIHDHRAYYKTPFGKHRNEYNIEDQTISEISQKKQLLEFVDNVQATQPQVCQMNCPRIAQ